MNKTTKLVINIDNKAIEASVDNYGNLYFDFCDKTYQLNVGANNEPILDVNNSAITNQNANVTRGNIVNADKFVDDTYLIEDNGHECVYKCVKSEEYFDDDFYQNYQDDCVEQSFVFYGVEPQLEIVERENSDVNALYDLFIYDDKEQETHGKLFLQTKIPDEICPYRVALYTSGKFFFRPIGCDVEKKYKLTILDNEIKIIMN